MSTFEICERSSRLNVVYPRQYIKKCCSCSMQSSLHAKHVRSSTGINAPLFSYLPVCIRSAWHPNLSLVRLILCAGFENLLRLLRVQKRCARIILDASYSDNSVELFSELGWLPIDVVIRMAVALSTLKIASPMLTICIDIIRGRQQIPLFRTNSGLYALFMQVSTYYGTH